MYANLVSSLASTMSWCQLFDARIFGPAAGHDIVPRRTACRVAGNPARRRGVFPRLALGLAIAMAPAGVATADDLTTHHGKLIVDKIHATAGEAGGQSILHFRITNDSDDHAYLLGVSSPVAPNARIVARISHHNTTVIDSASVRADSDLDLTTNHMWVELGPLLRTLRSGETIPIELIFARTRIRINAHVHGAAS